MIEHYGLYFTRAAVQRVRHRKAPFKDALAALDVAQPTEPLAAAVTEGFRYRFLADEDAAARAVHTLTEQVTLPTGGDYVHVCARGMAAGHAFEMVREKLPDEARRAWLGRYRAHVETLRQPDLPLLERIWHTAAEIVGAVVLDDDDGMQAGSAGFRRIIDEHIHPEGYLPELVERSEGGALVRQVRAAQGLSLAAEAASHAGVDLWGYEVRGISVKTAAIYAAAYYDYRDTWQWDTPPSDAENEAFYRQHAAFLEMLNRQLRPGVLRETLEALRPLNNPYGGGLTTLSHGEARRGLFGL